MSKILSRISDLYKKRVSHVPVGKYFASAIILSLMPFCAVAHHTHHESAEGACNGASNASSSDKKGGDFDYYMFAQEWAIERCYQNCNSVAGCLSLDQNSFAGKNFRAHGLWPNTFPADQKSPSPGFCNSTPELRKADLSKDLKLKLKESGKLNFLFLDHEWQKHGTCSPFGREEYFQHVMRLDRLFTTPAIVHDNLGGQISYADFMAAYGGEECLQADCSFSKDGKTQHISQVSFALSKDFSRVCGSKYLDNHYSKEYSKNRCRKDLPISIRNPNLESLIN